MNLKTKLLLCLLLLACSVSYGQMDKYRYKRELQGISDQWHKIILPDEVFGKVTPDLYDIRIYGITDRTDTIEAPYLLRLSADNTISREITFKTINTSKNSRGYFFTFEIPSDEPVNQIQLDFTQTNFDWRISLEGSQNLADWYTITEDDRILSIKNEITDFQFTTLTFPDSKYRYFRLLIKSKEKPELTAARIGKNEISEGVFKSYPVNKWSVKENKETKSTEIDVELQMPVPLSLIHIGIKDAFDYFRPVTISYLSDSTKTETGWICNYSILTSGTLNSLDRSDFRFSSTTVKRLRITVENQDNQPLTVESVQAQGYEHALLVRFTEPATYFLTYGNKGAAGPQYDIERFANKLPAELKALKPGRELLIEKAAAHVTEPLFKNRIWLWAIMGLIMVVLGRFSFKMIKNG